MRCESTYQKYRIGTLANGFAPVNKNYLNTYMKRILCGLLIFLLSACSVVQTTPFDSNEYSNFIEVLTTSEQIHAMCGSADPQQLLVASRLLDAKAHHLTNHAKYQNNNEQMVEITTIIRETTLEMLNRYQRPSPPSVQFCQAKTLVIRAQAELGARAAQQKMRPQL